MHSMRFNCRFKSWINKKKDPQRITKIKPFINQCNLEGITFPSENHNWKKIERINTTIALNVLYPKNEKTDVSKHNSNWEKQVIILMISNGKRQDHLASIFCNR